MARFGRSFLQAATQPAYMEGLFTAAQQLGSLPRRRRLKEELEEINKLPTVARLSTLISRAKDFGLSDAQVTKIENQLKQAQLAEANRSMVSISREIPNAVNAEQFKQLLSDAYDLQANSGVDTSRLVTTITEAANKKSIQNTFASMGQEYLDLYNMGISPKDILERQRTDAEASTKKELGRRLGMEEDVAEALTITNLMERIDAQKSQEGIDEFSSFIRNTKGVITADNYDEAVDKAVKAQGVQGIQNVNNMYANNLERQAKAKKERIVEANVTLKQGLGSVSLGGPTNITKVKVSLDRDGNLTPESKAYLENVAKSAFIPSANIMWPPEGATPSDRDNNLPPKGEESNDPTVGSLL